VSSTTSRRDGARTSEDADSWAAAGGGRLHLLEGDIRDPEVCREAVRGVDYVLHQAAIPSVPRSIQDPVASNAVNVGGTLNLLVAARDARVKRFVFASSSSVYGEGEALPKVESMPPAPLSPYGLQKLAGETYSALFDRLYGLPTVSLRYFNVFGPRQNPDSEYAAVIPRFITAVKTGETPIVYGDGEQSRDFTFIADVVEANLLACEAGGDALGRSFNIACGRRTSLNQVLGFLGEISGTRARADYQPPRAGDIRHSQAGIDLAVRHLGFRPGVEFLEGLRRTWRAL
jgi:nucleoside-diphosphate-sugar epimerase